MSELKEGLTRIYGDTLKAVYLYGSYARGDYRDGSDVDLMILLSDYQDYLKEWGRSSDYVSDVSLEYDVTIIASSSKKYNGNSLRSQCYTTFAEKDCLHEGTFQQTAC